MKSCFFILCNTLCFFSFAQSLEGVWIGNSAKTIFIKHPESTILELSIYDSLISGVSHLYYKANKYEHHKIKGKINWKDSTVLIIESFIETNVDKPVFEVQYKMKLIIVGNVMRLEGNWKPADSEFGFKKYNKVWFEKVTDTVLKMEHVSKINATNNSQNIEEGIGRNIDIQKIIEITDFEKDSINISVYDNGEIDGDSISLFFNGTTLIDNKGLSNIPISFTISITRENKFNILKMLAKNLGSIPPNTALLIITTRKNRYEVRLTSSLNNTGSVEFVLLD